MKSNEESILSNKKKNSKNVDTHLKTRNDKLVEKGYIQNNNSPPFNVITQKDKEKPKKKSSWFRKSKKVEELEPKLPPQIGVPLEDLYMRIKCVPEIIIECINHTKKNLETEGLFRIPGDVQKMKEIEKQLQIGNFEKLDENVGQHTAASMLKHYFRELPEPLFTFQHHNNFVDTLKLNEEEFIKESIRLINLLPYSHRLIILTIFPLLCEVSNFSSKNLMNESNLGIVFGPTLMKSIEESNGHVDMSNKKANYVEFLIMRWDRVSPSIQKKEDLLPGINTALSNLSTSFTTVTNNNNNGNSSPQNPNNVQKPNVINPPNIMKISGDLKPLKKSKSFGTTAPKKTPPPINTPPPSINYDSNNNTNTNNQNTNTNDNNTNNTTTNTTNTTNLNNSNNSPTLQPVNQNNVVNNNNSQQSSNDPNNQQVNYIYAVALYNYVGDPQKGQIDLVQNFQVLIHSKYSGGWAFGFCNGKSGYFPCSYVREF